jgi:multicomponent K+:H+ antiporter subunit C
MTLPISIEALVASGIGCVTAAGIYLMLRGRTFPVVVGLMLVGYAVNVFIFAMGRLWNAAPPILGAAPLTADPLPQALVLTAIVIGFATTGFVLELALRSRHETGSDHVDGDPAEADRDRTRNRRAAARRDEWAAGDGGEGPVEPSGSTHRSDAPGAGS